MKKEELKEIIRQELQEGGSPKTKKEFISWYASWITDTVRDFENANQLLLDTGKKWPKDPNFKKFYKHYAKVNDEWIKYLNNNYKGWDLRD